MRSRMQLPQPTMLFGGDKVGNALNYQQTGFFIAALQYEHEAQDLTEVAVSEAIAQTQAGHASRVFQDEASR